MSESRSRYDDPFCTTVWPVILEARADPTALAAVVETYRPALRLFLLRRFRLQEQDAEDLLQEFLLRKQWLRVLVQAADPDRGLFRQLLARSAGNFVRDAFRSARSANKRLLALPEYDLADERASDLDAIDESWADALVGDVIQRLYAVCQSQPDLWKVWNVFKARYLEPEPWTGDRIAQEFELRKGQVDGVARRGRLAFRELALRRLEEQGGADDDALGELCAALHKQDRSGRWRRTSEPYLGLSAAADSSLELPAEAVPRVGEVLQAAETEEQELRRSLAMPLRDLGVASPGTLMDLLTAELPAIDQLTSVKEAAKQRRKRADAAGQRMQEVWTWVYAATLAVTLVRHGARISDKTPHELRQTFHWAIGHGWGNLALARTFAEALARLEGQHS